MAVNEARSMNADLKKGVNDGLYKSLTPDRGGEPELQSVAKRSSDLQLQYNMPGSKGCGCGYGCGCI